MISEPWKGEWEKDCLKWRGTVLTGRFSHWCCDWDFLPVDETTPEWPCPCATELTLENAYLDGVMYAVNTVRGTTEMSDRTSSYRSQESK